MIPQPWVRYRDDPDPSHLHGVNPELLARGSFLRQKVSPTTLSRLRRSCSSGTWRKVAARRKWWGPVQIWWTLQRIVRNPQRFSGGRAVRICRNIWPFKVSLLSGDDGLRAGLHRQQPRVTCRPWWCSIWAAQATSVVVTIRLGLPPFVMG